MSETKKRKSHTAEYKARVGLEAIRSQKTINEIGQEFGRIYRFTSSINLYAKASEFFMRKL